MSRGKGAKGLVTDFPRYASGSPQSLSPLVPSFYLGRVGKVSKTWWEVRDPEGLCRAFCHLSHPWQVGLF